MTVKGQTQTLPEEQFWKRYSPHFEFPLANAASWALHVVAGVFLALIVIGYSLGWWADHTSPDIDAITIAGGGGGSPTGVGGGPGIGDPPMPQENLPDQPPTDPKKPIPAVSLPDLPAGPVDPIALPTFKDDSGQRVIDQGNAALAQMAKVTESARTKMFGGLAGKGQGGSGSGGGQGSGVGTGQGSGVGDGKGKLSERQERLLRWAIQFKTLDGSDYVRQLDRLGAMIGIPEPNGEYRLYKDLKARPAKGEIENLSDIKRIYWVDSRSVLGICEALKIPRPAVADPHFVAFFPEAFELKLAELEKQYLTKKYPGKTVKDVEETSFEVVSNEPFVRVITLKEGR